MTSQKYCKRLIEVDLPIKRISKCARDEKDGRQGHIPKLHIYPAARPTAACRAVILAALWPDPLDLSEILKDSKNKKQDFTEVEEFLVGVRKQILIWIEKCMSTVTQETFSRLIKVRNDPIILNDQSFLRIILFDFIAEFSSQANSLDKNYINIARSITLLSNRVLTGSQNNRPLVIDPFAGGGAIPLEALRVGADAFASDLNPIAVLINLTILKYIPRYGHRLADELLKWQGWFTNSLEKKLGKFFPNDDDGAIPTAYLWARTVLSESPGSGDVPVEIPLIKSMWLTRKRKENYALRWAREKDGKIKTQIVDAQYSDGTKRKVKRPILEIFIPSSQAKIDQGTLARNSATCPITGFTTSAQQVEKQLKLRKGGAADARLYCVVIDLPNGQGRSFRIPTDKDLDAVKNAQSEILNKIKNSANGIFLIPNEPIPEMRGVIGAQIYGHETWGSLFTPRQQLAMVTYIELIENYLKDLNKINKEFAQAFAAILGLILDRLADLNASLCVWQLNTPNTAHVFGRWALPMVMDFGEINPLAGAGGSPDSVARRALSSIKDLIKGINHEGEVQLCSASCHPLPDDSVDFFFTDPPYYNAIPYADLLDFFYVWLRRGIYKYHPQLFNSVLNPKDEEICELSSWDRKRYAHKTNKFFEDQMTIALSHGRRILKPNGIGAVVFAHKSTSGWEAMLKALIEAGWVITASWPIDTEMASRLRAKNSAALASSVHIIVRPRENQSGELINDLIGDWRDVLQELPNRIHEWMPRLAKEGIVGADAIFACLGPALEIFSKYSHVEKASGEKVELREYLEQVWGAVAKEALNMIFEGAQTEGFEEDARLTAMWLWTLSTGINGKNKTITDDAEVIADDSEVAASKTNLSGFSLEFDAARKIAQGLGIHLEELTSMVEIEGETARLLPVAERAKYLFGKDSVAVGAPKRKKKDAQLTLDFVKEIEEAEQGWSLGEGKSSVGKTILDRVHQSMLLFAAGRSEALRRFLVEEGIGKDERFWRLAQALSALYPTHTDEKRWVDGVLAKKKSFGF